MKLDIEFSPHRPRTTARVWCFFVITFLMLIGAMWSMFSAPEKTQSLAESTPLDQRASTTKEPVLSGPQIEAINRAIRQLNLPWEQIISEVESRLSPEIALLAFEPQAAHQLLRLQGEASSAQAMLDFVGDLEDPAFFRKTALIHHEIDESDPNRPVRFIVEAQWLTE